jgi:hypothetical protein
MTITIFPQRYQVQIEQRLQAQIAKLYCNWREDYDRHHPAPPIENVRFAHNPAWRYQFFSIQSARDANHIIWKATRVALAVVGGSI